ncbi:MAG: hypothetical protein H6Q68_2874 [Firmicutes bacterium]|nr:hypothetical protein [Bacillota bacterium]
MRADLAALFCTVIDDTQNRITFIVWRSFVKWKFNAVHDMPQVPTEHGRYLYMIFFCQQSMEKIFKGLYFKMRYQTPPRKHDLLALAASCNLLDELSIEQKTFLVTVSSAFLSRMHVSA